MTSVSPSQRAVLLPWKNGSGLFGSSRPSRWITRQLFSTAYSCTSSPGLCTIIVVYGFCSQMAGSPLGMQLTEDFDSSSSVGVIDLILASASGLNCGGASGVTLGSKVRIASGSTPKRPDTPCPAPFGNQ